MISRKIISTFMIPFAFGSLVAHGATTGGANASSFAVTVNGEALPAKRGEYLLRAELARGVKDSPELRSSVKEILINQALMAQDAIKAGVDKKDEVGVQLDLARQGVLVRAWEQHELEGLKISDSDLKEEYQKQVHNLGKEAFQLRHILLSDEKSAQQVQDKLKAGADFDALAKELSADAATRARGGLSDWLPVGRLDPRIFQAVQDLKPGQYAAAPVQTAAGWQVLRLEGRRPYTAPSMSDVLPQLRVAVSRHYLEQRLKALRDAAKVTAASD